MIAATLEANALARRYHQANVVLMARAWTSYLGFVTGMILALVGAVFVLGRVQEVPASIEAKYGPMSGSLQTAAPGIVLAVLGVSLMIAALFVPYNITVTDKSIYLASPRGPTGESEPQAPRINFPAEPPSPQPDAKK